MESMFKSENCKQADDQPKNEPNTFTSKTNHGNRFISMRTNWKYHTIIVNWCKWMEPAWSLLSPCLHPTRKLVDLSMHRPYPPFATSRKVQAITRTATMKTEECLFHFEQQWYVQRSDNKKRIERVLMKNNEIRRSSGKTFEEARGSMRINDTRAIA